MWHFIRVISILIERARSSFILSLILIVNHQTFRKACALSSRFFAESYLNIKRRNMYVVPSVYFDSSLGAKTCGSARTLDERSLVLKAYPHLSLSPRVQTSPFPNTLFGMLILVWGYPRFMNALRGNGYACNGACESNSSRRTPAPVVQP